MTSEPKMKQSNRAKAILTAEAFLRHRPLSERLPNFALSSVQFPHHCCTIILVAFAPIRRAACACGAARKPRKEEK